MRRLVIVRHAKSDWGDASLADRDRPLAPRGIGALGRMRDHLGVVAAPDLVLCSPARRTRETLDGIRSAFAADVDIRIEDALYGATSQYLLDRVGQVGDDVATLALVGHNPGVHDLVLRLIDRSRSDADLSVARFPTGAIATMSFDGSWSDLASGGARLDDVFTPRG